MIVHIAGETGWGDKDAAAWIDSIPSPSYEWDAAGDTALPTTGNWGEWNSYISSDPEFATGREGVSEGLPFHVDDDDLFTAVADVNEEVLHSYIPAHIASFYILPCRLHVRAHCSLWKTDLPS